MGIQRLEQLNRVIQTLAKECNNPSWIGGITFHMEVFTPVYASILIVCAVLPCITVQQSDMEKLPIIQQLIETCSTLIELNNEKETSNVVCTHTRVLEALSCLHDQIVEMKQISDLTFELALNAATNDSQQSVTCYRQYFLTSLAQYG